MPAFPAGRRGSGPRRGHAVRPSFGSPGRAGNSLSIVTSMALLPNQTIGIIISEQGNRAARSTVTFRPLAVVSPIVIGGCESRGAKGMSEGSQETLHVAPSSNGVEGHADRSPTHIV